MNEIEIKNMLDKQRAYFREGNTLDVKFRIKMLKKLYIALDVYEDKLFDALKADLGKSSSEAYMCELALVKSEIEYMVRHLPKYAREHRVHTPIAQFLSKSFEKPTPYGQVLIMSPWNYPVLLALDPLVDALAAGNTAIVKPSAYSPETSSVLREILSECYPEEYVAVVTGGRAENQELLSQDFDYIFFTGSKSVGQEVIRRSANYLIPVTLELGGKSPCIVDSTADISLAARRIVFGKFLNCGQTCVAPDFIYCDSIIKNQLMTELRLEIIRQFGENSLNNPDYGKIINNKHFNRLSALIDESRVYYGGQRDEHTDRIAPTIVDASWGDEIMKEEIFGPILPVVTYDSIDEVIDRLQKMESPLALYIFSSNKKNIKKVLNLIQFGGGCVNDTIIHLATSEMGFGGVGSSGMGLYHGKRGFDTFTHYKNIVDKKTIIDLQMRYQPYTKFKDCMVRLFVR